MIADNEAKQRFDTISQMSAEIATLNTEIDLLKHARDAARLRAERAELVVRQLEVQIASPLRQVKTVYTSMTLKVEREEHDTKIAKLASDGWSFVCDGSFLYGQAVERYTTLMRVAPIEPAPDFVGTRHALSADDIQPTINESLTVQTEGNAADASPHSSISSFWNALYALDRFAELVQHWPKLAEFAPRVHAVFAATGCDMTDVVIMKSFRFGHNADEWTLKAIFPTSAQIQTGTRAALIAAGFGTVIQRDGREFIFDLPEAWVAVAPRKTITASSMTIIDEDAAPVTESPEPARNFGHIANDRAALSAQVNDPEITHEDFYRSVMHSRLPRDEQDVLIAQSRQLRVGGKIAQQLNHLPRFQSRPLNQFQTGTK